MKRCLFALVALTLALALTPWAAAENDSADLAMSMAFLSGLSDCVAFQLPGGPSLMKDEDYPGFFTDSHQLLGYCVEDGMEYQLRASDIGPMVESIREDVMAQVPGATEDVVRVNALMSYAMMIPGTYGAELQSTHPHGYREKDWLWLDATFTYPDTPGVIYHLKAMLSGTQATTLIIGDCPHAQQVLDALRFVDEEELTALRATMTTETTCDLNGLTVTFPREPITMSSGDTTLVGAFSADWASLQVQYQIRGLDIGTSEEDQLAFMIAGGKKVVSAYGSEAVNDPVLSHPSEDMLQLDFRSTDERHFGEMGPVILVRVYVGERGIWYVTANDTEDGRRFMDSVHLTDTAESAEATK